MRMKRKEVEEATSCSSSNDDFSDFPFSSPATKIRRLDVELSPIVEEEETMHTPTPQIYHHHNPVEQQDKAIVIYNTNNNNPMMLYSPNSSSSSNISLSLHSDFISAFKNQFYKSSGSSVVIKPIEEEEEEEETSNEMSSSGSCTAVVPWIPSRLNLGETVGGVDTQGDEMMEAEQDEVATMDIEEDNSNNTADGNANWIDFARGGGLPQWHQQHCFVPNHLPYNTNVSTPISWSHS